MSASRLAIVFSLGAGLASAGQASVSGALGRRVGTVQAAAFGAAFAAALVMGLALVLGRGGGLVAVVRQPAWLWLGGVFGASIVLALAYAPPIIGTFATVALLIAGQLVAGVLIDAFGLLGSPRLPVTSAKVAGLILLAAGAALTLRR